VRATAQTPQVQAELDAEVEPLDTQIEDFWSLGAALDDFRVSSAPPQVSLVLIKRVGAPPFWRGPHDFMAVMRDVYEAAGDLQLLLQPPPLRTDWAEAADDHGAPPVFDLRATEGMLAQLASEMGEPASVPNRKLEKAQQLMYRAWAEDNPARRIALAHDALVVSPDCADAYVLLAEEEARTIEKAVEYYREGVDAGARALGKEYLEQWVGHFWGLIETRPYMRARMGLAGMLWKLQRFDEAIAHYRELLRLNPNDNQGARYVLLNLLMFLERDAEVRQLLAQYQDEYSAAWFYSRALQEFRRGGASAAANAALREALKENAHVPNYITGEKRIPPAPPQTMGFGDENEAVSYAVDHLNIWRRTAGAVEWLKAQHVARASPPKKRTSRKGCGAGDVNPSCRRG